MKRNNVADQASVAPSETEFRAGFQALSGLRLFFGHQSVGGNVLAGIGEVCGELGMPAPAIVETKSATAVSAPAIYHAAIGANMDPRSKIAEFDSLLRSGMAGEVDAAFMKLCYADVDASTDVEGLLREYGKAMADYIAMRPEYSDDGGHLNAAGRRRISGRLILALSSEVSSRR